MKKSHIIILISILAIFIVSMVILFIQKNKENTPIEESLEHNYATQTTITPTTSEEENITYDIESKGFSYDHIERLTYAQNTVRLTMNNLVQEYFIKQYHREDTIVSATISETSTKDIVYINFVFTDSNGIEFTDVAVVLYDDYTTNNFTRCLSIEEYNLIYD